MVYLLKMVDLSMAMLVTTRGLYWTEKTMVLCHIWSLNPILWLVILWCKNPMFGWTSWCLIDSTPNSWRIWRRKWRTLTKWINWGGALGHSTSNEGAWWACIEKRDGTPLNVTTWHVQPAGWPTRCNVAEIWARCSDDSYIMAYVKN